MERVTHPATRKFRFIKQSFDVLIKKLFDKIDNTYTTIITIPLLSRLSLALNKAMTTVINVIHTSCRSESSNYKLGRLDKFYKRRICYLIISEL